MDALREYFASPSIHAEPRQRTREQAREYCRKPDTRVAGPWEFGDFGSSRQGRRSDLHQVAERIVGDRPGRLADLALEFPCEYIKYSNGIGRLHFIQLQRNVVPFREVSVSVFYGPPGTGKTRRVMAIVGADYFFLDPDDRAWYDGYDGQANLVLDDFCGWIRLHQLLRILDGYPLRIPVKGGFTWAAWTNVYITSNYHPEQWYNTTPEHADNIGRGRRRDPEVLLAALMRRIGVIEEML